jgi:tRNA pseudouridine32 synthase / 23S rRNA pseudouridine746 synthase
LRSTSTPPGDCGIDLVHCCDSVVVVNKPAGLLTVPGRGADKTDSLVSRVQREFPDALCVHRLDMSTSGLLVLARGKEMHSHLSRLFRERMVKKYYIAILNGRLQASAGEIDLPLDADWPNRPRQRVALAGGKSSLTRYRLLAHDAPTDTSRVELEPATGRTHQLRVHMAAIGHPIAGDRLYGLEGGPIGDRLMLHASMLRFSLPSSAEPLSFECAAPF